MVCPHWRFFIKQFNSLGYETDAKVIALSYICSVGFVLDIVAVIPFELGAFGIPHHVLDWAITFKINRLIKLWKVLH